MARCPDCDFSCSEGALECSRCGATIAMVCAQCGAGNPALARFCCGCGSRLEATIGESGPNSLARPEWRQLTVFFCDVVGSTALGRKLDPEDWHRVIQRFHSQAGELVAKHTGYVAQYLGDGLLAYFGYPVATEDAPRRAVTAALEIARQVGEIAIGGAERLSVRIGIHTGPVIVGNIGSRRHQESLALGDTPNLAARLQEAAPSGGVVISPETKRLVAGFFEVEELGAFQLKGFSQPQSVFRVISERSPKTRLEAASAVGLTPLVGRLAQLGALKAAWARAVAGEPASIFMLRGEPGIGKSRLIHELKGSVDLREAAVLELRCSQHARNTVLHPVVESLQRQIGGRVADNREALRQQLSAALVGAGLTPPQVALLLAMFGIPIEPEFAPVSLREATLDAASAWIVGAQRPRLVIIEDLHWADPATLDLLAPLLSSPPPGLLFVLSARPEFDPNWTAASTIFGLERLDGDETRELVTRVAGNKPLPKEVVERLAARSECIPLFLEEMTKTVMESGLVRETTDEFVLDEPMRDSAIPATLYDSLTGRLDQLGHGKPVAQLGAVLGREFSYALFDAVWSKVPGVPEISVGEALERLVGAQLLVREGEHADALYRFRHSLIQEAAYQSLLRSTRRAYHRYAAQAIVERFSTRAELEPELVAHHYSGAEERRQAAEFWTKAGLRATGAAAYVEATNHFKGGLEQLAHLDAGAETSRLEIGLRSGLGLTLIARRGFASKDVEETYARAAELCHELGDEIPVRVLYGTWAVNVVRSDLASTTRMLPGLERMAASSSDASARFVALASLSTWEFWRGDYARVLERCALARELIDAEAPKEQHSALLRDHGFEGLYVPGVYLAWSQALVGEVTAARRSVRDFIDLAERMADPYVMAGVYAFGGAIHHDLGDLARAADIASKLLTLCQDKAFPFWQAVGLVVHGGCLMHRGEAEGAVASIEQGNGMFSATGAQTSYPYHRTYLAQAQLLSGNVARAIEVLEDSLRMMRTNIDRNFEPEVLRLLGEAYDSSGQAELAQQTLSVALELSRSQGARLLELKAATSLALMLERRGDRSGAKRVLEPSIASFPPVDDFVPLRKAGEVLQRINQGVA